MGNQKRYGNTEFIPPRPSTLLEKTEALHRIWIAHHNLMCQWGRNVGYLGLSKFLLLPLLCRHWPRARTRTTFIGWTNRSDTTGQRNVKSFLLLEAWFKCLQSGWSSILPSTLISSGHQCSECLFNVVYTSISTISSSTNIYLNINLGHTFLILTSYTRAWICFLRRVDIVHLLNSTISQLS
jgi:hypothetical protein